MLPGEMTGPSILTPNEAMQRRAPAGPIGSAHCKERLDISHLAGLVGIVPALGMMTKEQNPAGGPIVFPWWKLMLWSLALAFLGVFIAVPLRTQTVIKVIHASRTCGLPTKDFSAWVPRTWQTY